MTVADRAMGAGLKVLNRFAGSDTIDRLGLRGPAQRLLTGATREGFRAAARASRTFAAAQRLAKPARPATVAPRGLFDLTPTDEQQMIRDSVGEFAADRVRPAAEAADEACAAPAELLEQANELGLATLGIPEQLGGPLAERSAVTTVLVAEALAHGDMGIALAALAPGAVSAALGLWGDADQQARYLPPFVADDPPAAALALAEPRSLFDPLAPQARARRVEGGYELRGVKALVPRAADAELFLVGAELEGRGPALFALESGTAGVLTEPDPAMGLRAAATARLVLEDARVPARALLAEGDPDAYRECVRRARLAWCALALGTCRAVLDYVIPYVNERVAFGEPISNRQAVAFQVADIGIELEGMRLLTYRAASRADAGRPFARELALARRLCSEQAMAIGSAGVQLLGGHGYVKDHPVERWYRDLRSVGLMEGGVLA